MINLIFLVYPGHDKVATVAWSLWRQELKARVDGYMLLTDL